MRAAFVVRGDHLPTKFNTVARTRVKMLAARRLWLIVRRIPGILGGDLNVKRPWKRGPQIQHLASHSVDNIYGTEEWAIVNTQVVELTGRRLSDHDAVKAILRHPTGGLLTVATVNLKRHWAHPGDRAAKIAALLDADVGICNEVDEAQVAALRWAGFRVYQARSNSRRGPWVGNCIYWDPKRVTATKRRQRAVAYIYLRGKKKRRRPRVPVPAVNFSPVVWFAFVPTKKEN